MKTDRRPVRTWQMGLLNSLSQGCTVIPLLLFSGLAIRQPGATAFFVPAVIVYTVQRACLVCLRGFGGIGNPYRIMKAGLGIALAGSLLVLFSLLYAPLLFFGALLVGIGFSPYASMFAPLREALSREYPAAKKGGGLGSFFYLVIVLLMMTFKKSAFPFVRILFLLYTGAILFIVCRLDGDALFGGAPAFDTKKRKPVYFIHAGLMLLCLLVLRQYKYSGVSALIWAAPAAVIVSTVVEMNRHLGYRDFVYETYWAGGMKSFLLVFSLVYHASVGNSSMLTLTYLALTLGSVLTALIAKPVRKLLPEERFARICMILSAGFAFLLAVPSQAVNFAGILLSAAFAGLVSGAAKKEYMLDERHEVLERPLVKDRITAVGGVEAQLFIFLTVFLIGKYHSHDNLLLAYTSGTPDPGVAAVFRTVCLVCCGLMLLAAVLIAVFAPGRKKER